MNEVTLFKCPDCGLQCRLSTKQRAVQHQVPDCKTWTKHKAGNAQEFLRLALMAAGGAAFNLGSTVVDIEHTAEEKAATARIAERAKRDLTEELYEGLKKL